MKRVCIAIMLTVLLGMSMVAQEKYIGFTVIPAKTGYNGIKIEWKYFDKNKLCNISESKYFFLIIDVEGRG